jgi:uncharacterized membrane protein YdbT with pleckstrin-like domain
MDASPTNHPASERSAAHTPADAGTGVARTDRNANPQLQPEQDLWAGRMHWHNAIGRVLTWVLINVGLWVAAWKIPRPDWMTSSRVAWVVFGLFVVTTLVMLGGVIIRILNMRYRLTTQRLFIERGILSRTMDQTELIRVDDVRMQQSFINRIFNVGTVQMITTDATDKVLAIEGVKDPVRVSELIRQQMRTLRSKSVFVENL